MRAWIAMVWAMIFKGKQLKTEAARESEMD